MQLNPMFPETLLECITELNTTCVTMNAFRKSFEGHGRRRLNMFNTSFENSKRALFREQKEDKHPTQELSNEYLLAKIGVDTEENEPYRVCSFG